LHLGLARAGLREDGLVLVDEVALGGVIDGRVGDGHRRHRHRVGDEYGHGRLNAEPPGEGHPRHIAELLGQDGVGGVRVDPEALGEVSPFLLVAERGHRDTAHALRHVRDLLPPARAGRSGGLGDLLTPQLDAVPQARHTTGEALHRLTGTRSSTVKWGPLSSSGATRSFALSTGSVSKPDWPRAVITVAPMIRTVIIAMDESVNFTVCVLLGEPSSPGHASSGSSAGGPLLSRPR